MSAINERSLHVGRAEESGQGMQAKGKVCKRVGTNGLRKE